MRDRGWMPIAVWLSVWLSLCVSVEALVVLQPDGLGPFDHVTAGFGPELPEEGRSLSLPPPSLLLPLSLPPSLSYAFCISLSVSLSLCRSGVESDVVWTAPVDACGPITGCVDLKSHPARSLSLSLARSLLLSRPRGPLTHTFCFPAGRASIRLKWRADPRQG